MKKILIFAFILMNITLFAQNESRFIEVTGKAVRKIKADRITYLCSINEGDRCEIPTGKNYEKMIKNCAEENKKLFATRISIYEGVLASFGSKITKPGEKQGTRNLTANSKELYFKNYDDVIEFENKLYEFKDAFSGYISSAICSNMNEAEYQKLQIESLLNTQKKAEAMVQVFGNKIDKVLNIYEYSPYSQNQQLLIGGANGLPEFNASGIDENGEITYTATTLIRFSIK